MRRFHRIRWRSNPLAAQSYEGLGYSGRPALRFAVVWEGGPRTGPVEYAGIEPGSNAAGARSGKSERLLLGYDQQLLQLGRDQELLQPE